MNMKRALSLLNILLLLSPTVSCRPDPVVNPDPKPEPDPAPAGVELTFTASGAHGIELHYDASAKVYSFITNGDDPYLYSDKLSSDLAAGYVMLSFEYTASAAVNDLQIFYNPGGIPSEANSGRYGKLAATTVWTPFAVSIKKFRDGASWGRAGDNIRIDPGDNAGVTLKVRNAVVRPMTDEEKKEYQEELDQETAKQRMAENLDAYLSRNYPSKVTSVVVTAAGVTVKGECGGAGPFALVEVTPWEDVTEMKRFPYRSDLSGGSFAVTFERTARGREGIDYDRVFSKWAVVKVDGERDILDSHARYADEVVSKAAPEAVPLRNKKGFGAGPNQALYYSDLTDAGVGSITMNVLLNGFISNGSGYSYGGRNYRIDAGYASVIDTYLLEARKRGVVVSAILLIPSNSLFKDPENTGGYYSMPNMTTAEAFNLYAAGLEYMAARYCSAAHGRIHHWIMHNEADMGKDWTNMGDQPLMRYLDRYIKSMRICYNIVRQYDPNASVLGSYTHNWTQADEGFAPKTMLEKTVEYSGAEGDFRWGVACHPYPQDLTAPAFWKNDSRSTYDMDTKYVTFKNLEVLDKWIKLPGNLYKGTTKRVLFLSENGTNSPTYSKSDLELQAAGACWAWKKVSRLDGIDAVQWHNWADNRFEFGLRIGLRAYEEAPFKDMDPKPVWYVWQAAGTDKESEVFDPYLSVIGISSWDEIFHDL